MEDALTQKITILTLLCKQLGELYLLNKAALLGTLHVMLRSLLKSEVRRKQNN